MLILVFFFALALTFLGWYISRDIFAPYTISPAIWAFIIFLYYFLPNDYYTVCHDFPLCLSLWMTGFFLFSCIGERLTSPASSSSTTKEPNKWVLRAYMAITLTGMPLVCGVILWKAFTEEPETMFRYMRMMSTGMDENIEMPNVGPLIYCVSVGFITMFYVLMYAKSKWLMGAVIFVNMIYALVTMAKTNFLSLFFTLLYLGYARGVLKMKHFAYGGVAFLAVCIFVQTARYADGDSGFGLTGTLALYLVSSFVAFDYYAVPFSCVNPGENVFRLFYAVGHAVGVTDKPIETILPFVCVPVQTNTYTALYPFYTDFGIGGVVVFSIIYGLIYGFLYKRVRTGSKSMLILYAVFLVFLLMQFIGEFIFTNLSMTFQYVFFAVLPFLLADSQKQDTLCLK